MNWSEAAFWRCSWGGLDDAWAGYRRFVLGVEEETASMTRAEAEALERDVVDWRDGGG